MNRVLEEGGWRFNVGNAAAHGIEVAVLLAIATQGYCTVTFPCISNVLRPGWGASITI